MMKVSIIIPVLNEANSIVGLLSSLSALRAAGHEVLVVDGGSTDGTQSLARPLCDKLILSCRGRALQMNSGARQATGEMLWFLHADSSFSTKALDAVPDLFKEHAWGRFDLCLSGERTAYRVIERMINLRSRLTGIATGDQGIFVDRNLFWDVGGYPDIPLMEDVALSRELLRKIPPLNLRHKVQTSSRRWEQDGLLATVLLMWKLRFQFYLGADPGLLVKRYYN